MGDTKIVHIAFLGPRAALIHLAQPVAANCCDGRMVMLVVNRDGKTRCTSCDSKLSEG